MKNIIINLLLFFLFIVSCKGQDKDRNNNVETLIYYANCTGEYSTGEKLTEKNKTWSLNKSDVDRIMNLSNRITENEWHFSYSVTPCNIDFKGYFYKGRKWDLQINGGSYISLHDGKKTILLGCASPECYQYFLKPVESMEEKNLHSNMPENNSKNGFKTYTIALNKNNKEGVLSVKNNGDNYALELKIDDNIYFNKKFTCDFIKIETNTKNKQNFNLILGYSDQYKKIFKKVVMPVFYKNDDLFIEKIFVTTLGNSAKTGNEEWTKKEIRKKILLKQINLDEF